MKLRKIILLTMTGYAIFIGMVGIIANATHWQELEHPWFGAGEMAPQTSVCIVCLGIALFFKKCDK